jgi:hypothetical protein
MSFWKRRPFRSGSNIGSSRSNAGVSGCPAPGFLGLLINFSYTPDSCAAYSQKIDCDVEYGHPVERGSHDSAGDRLPFEDDQVWRFLSEARGNSLSLMSARIGVATMVSAAAMSWRWSGAECWAHLTSPKFSHPPLVSFGLLRMRVAN